MEHSSGLIVIIRAVLFYLKELLENVIFSYEWNPSQVKHEDLQFLFQVTQIKVISGVLEPFIWDIWKRVGWELVVELLKEDAKLCNLTLYFPLSLLLLYLDFIDEIFALFLAIGYNDLQREDV